MPLEKRNAYCLSTCYESGGAGLFSTVTDYGRFAAAMSCGGQTLDGTRILRAETIDLIRTPQTDAFEGFDASCASGYDYGLGVRTLVNHNKGQRSALGEFGWDGVAGAYTLMDPKKQVAVAYMQHMHDSMILLGDFRDSLRDLTYEALGL